MLNAFGVMPKGFHLCCAVDALLDNPNLSMETETTLNRWYCHGACPDMHPAPFDPIYMGM